MRNKTHLTLKTNSTKL